MTTICDVSWQFGSLLVKLNNNISKRSRRIRLSVIVFNTTPNNISAMSWWSVLLVAEPGGPRENHSHVTSH
jgi:hypothetical protein